MNRPPALFLFAAAAACLSACASPQISHEKVAVSQPEAVAIVTAAKRAHGQEAFAGVRELTVHYDGQWGKVMPRIQPVLADRDFRQGSVEKLSFSPRRIAQEHTGPSGKKLVLRATDKVTVSYNGAVSTDTERRKAAALVADAYALFLLGPFYFDRPGVILAAAPPAVVDGQACDGILAVMQPGFGFAPEDRVVLYIDRNSKLLRRVRLTLNGLDSTQGAEVDVTFREFTRIGGVLWPTDFEERVRAPFDLHAHHWKLTKLEVNRGRNAPVLSWSLPGGSSPAGAVSAPRQVRGRVN